MLYKSKVAVCSQINIKHSTQSEHHVEFFNVKSGSRRMRWAGHVARMGEERGTYRFFLGETGGKETTGET